MFEFFKSLVQIVAPIFVVSTMLNVGLTQTLSDIIRHLKNYPFVLKMLVANFVVAPLLMIALLYFTPGAILVGLAFVAAAFGIGYLAGAGQDHLEDVGGLGTAQRNTAAGVIIATQNFSDHPDVLVMITLANILGIVMLLFIARALSSDNKVKTETV